jgi:predicted nucleic acid-binding protein
LTLLQALFDEALVPEAVWEEVVVAGRGRAGSERVARTGWLRPTRLASPPDRLLLAELGPGEAEVIALAVERRARWTLLDERRARQVATAAYGLAVRGTAGILVAARRQDLTGPLRPQFEALRAQGYFLSARLVDRACAEVGES